MKLSRSRSSLARVVRSNVIFDPDANVPSEFSVKEPFAPVAVRTASDGRLTPTSCSRTRIVAFDLSLTVQPSLDVAAVATAVAGGVPRGGGRRRGRGRRRVNCDRGGGPAACSRQETREGGDRNETSGCRVLHSGV